MYEFWIFVGGFIIGGWACGFAAYKFSDWVWTQAMRGMSKEIPNSLKPAVLAALERAREGSRNGT